MTETEEKRLLSDLRVTELRQELEKRGLDKNGIKIILTNRLEKALIEEGFDPATYQFSLGAESPAAANSQPKKAPETQQPVSPKNDLVEKNDNVASATGEIDTKESSAPPAEVSSTGQQQPSAAPSVAANQRKSESPAPVATPTEKPAAEDVEMLEDPLDSKDVSKEAINVGGDEAASSTSTTAPPPASSATTTSASAKVTMPSIAAGEDSDSRSLWIRGISKATSAAALKTMCLKFGKVVRAKIFTSRSKKTTDDPTCFGFVTFVDEEMANKCLNELNGTELNGKTLNVEKANESSIMSAKGKTGNAASSSAETVKKPEEKKPVDTVRKDKDKPKEKVVAKPKVEEKKKPKERISVRKESSHSSHRTTIRHGREPDRRPISSRPPPPRRTIPPRLPSRPLISSRPPVHSRIHERVSRPVDLMSRPIDRLPVSSLRRPAVESWGRPLDYEDLLRKKEEEHRKREQELELEREKERIRFEREKLEREKLEMQLKLALHEQQQQQRRELESSTTTTSRSYAPTGRDRERDSRSARTADSRRPADSRDRDRDRNRVVAKTHATHAEKDRRPLKRSRSPHHRPSGATSRPPATETSERHRPRRAETYSQGISSSSRSAHTDHSTFSNKDSYSSKREDMRSSNGVVGYGSSSVGSVDYYNSSSTSSRNPYTSSSAPRSDYGQTSSSSTRLGSSVGAGLTDWAMPQSGASTSAYTNVASNWNGSVGGSSGLPGSAQWNFC